MSINKKGQHVPLAQASPDLAILGDRLTMVPPATTDSPADLAITATSSPDRALMESYARFRSAPIEALREISKTFLGTGWRSYDNPIGQPCFYSGYTEHMKSMVLESPILKARIAQLAKKQADSEAATDNDPVARRHREKELRDQLDEVADLWTDQMICKMESKSFIRGAYYLVTQLLTRAYHQGIHVNSEEVLHIRNVASEAAKKKQSIIFLPCHRSHIDYVSLQLICFRLGLTLPIVVAGDNLNFPVVGPFLQHAGALWIRRSFGEDALYGTLVQSYMDTLLQNGYNVECFIEGGRSRTGKLLSPKFGILSFMMESLLSGRVNDAIICPVSTQYDKVIEVDSYISELLGQPKEKESLAGFLSATNILSLKLGRVDVRFHKPWSLRDFINAETNKMHGRSQSLQVSYDSATKRKLLSVLGYQVLAHINDASVVMPTALIGTVLLTLRGRGVGESELVRRVEVICDKVRSRGGRVSHFGNLPTDVVVKRGLEVLGPKLVGKVEGLAEPSYFAVDRFQLSFYRNMTIHLFVSEALVCAALYTQVKHGGLENQSMSYAELRDYVFFLSQLFRTEFIFSSAPLAENLNNTLVALEKDGVLEVKRDGVGKVVEVGLSEAERELGRDNFDFYCFLIWPFIEASWLNAVSLLMLVPPPSNEFTSEDWLDYGQVQAHAQKLGKTLYHQGDLSYFEAVNKESLQKGYSREEEEGMLVIARSKESKVKPRVRLGEDWMPVRDEAGRIVLSGCKLWDFAERISISRREGKDRRDSATMQTRVIRFIDIVSEELWANAAVDKVANADVSDKKLSRRKLRAKPAKSARL